MEIGIYEFQFKGEKVGLRFGTRFFRLMQQKIKKDLSHILHMLGTGTYEFEFMADCFECAARDYFITNKFDINFNNDDMCDWIDTVGGAEEAVRIMSEGIFQYFPKNLKSLAETGEKEAITQ
jgi:hypothetical protein